MSTEIKAILFLHILAAMWLVAGILGYLVLYVRARRVNDATEARATLSSARAVERWLAQPGAGLVGILGLILLFRYSSVPGVDVGTWVWAHVSGVLWIVILIIGAILGRFTRRALILATDGSSNLAAVHAALSAGPFVALLVLMAAITMFTLYLMVFQPFVTA
jgi:uncharacterized membrane protein